MPIFSSGGGQQTVTWDKLAVSTGALVTRGLGLQTPSSVSSIAYPYPSGTVPGDLVLVLQNGSSFNPAGSSPGPFGLISTFAPTGGNVGAYFHQVQQEVVGTAAGCTVVGTSLFAGIIVTLGPSSGPPGLIVPDSEYHATFADAASITAALAALTTVSANCLIVAIAAHGGSAGNLSTSSTGWTAIGTPASAVGLNAWWASAVAAGTGSPQLVITDSGGTSTKGWALEMIAFKPLGSP